VGDGDSNHECPYGGGHKGDLPQLYAITGGKIINTVVAPRLTLSDIIGRDFIIHANPDDYAGLPGGARVAYGTIAVTETLETTVNLVNTTGIGIGIGKITATDSPDGLLLVADLTSIPAGEHYFHVHEHPDCGVSDDGTPAGKAGEHYSVDNEDRGILPSLEASTGDFVKKFVLAPTLDPVLTLNEIKGHSLVIHAADGSRLACGIIGQ
jgi:Cu-Zn family superoxide dismutase